MEHKVVFRAAQIAALAAFVCAILLGFVFRAPDPGVSLQPVQPGPLADFLRPIRESPALMLNAFAADSLFVISYLMVFVGLHATVAGRARTFAAVGLGAGILTALCDATENAYFITYALWSLNGGVVSDPELPAIYVIANLKWMAAFAALAAFGLAWPRTDRLGQVMSGLMLIFPLYGAVSVAVPALAPFRGLFFLIGMPLFAWHFGRQARS